MEIRGWVVAARCSCRLSLRGPAAPSSRSRRMTRARTRRPTRGEAVEGCARWPSGVGGLPLRPHAPGARAGTALGHPLRPRRDALHPHLLGGAQRDDARPGQVRQQGRPGQAHRRRARHAPMLPPLALGTRCQAGCGCPEPQGWPCYSSCSCLGRAQLCSWSVAAGSNVV
ncbi:hypothetical protein VPH35_077738 [Triticum aestivum]